MEPSPERPEHLVVLRIVAIYVLFGSAWIYLSDSLVALLVHNPVILTRIAVYKGLLFIIFTAILLYHLIARFARHSRKSLEALRESERDVRHREEQLRVVFDTSQAGIILIDSRGEIILANRRMAEMLECAPDGLIGSRYTDHVHPEEKEICDSRMRQLMAGEIDQVSDERRYLRSTGSDFWGYLSVRRHQDGLGRLVSLVAIIVDITERKGAEEELRHAKDYTENLLQAANVIIVGLDPAGSVTLMNRTAEEITGYVLGELLGRNWFDVVVPGGAGSEVFGKFKNINDRGLLDSFETPIVTKRGEQRTISWRSNPIFKKGAVTGTISFGLDITEHRRLEQQFLQSQKMESIGRLAGGVAHDFNNMLTVIMAYAEISRQELPEDAPVRKHILEIEKAAVQSRDLTRKLLTFSRQQIISPRPVSLNVLIMETEKALAPLIGEDINLRFHPGSDLGMIVIDPSQVDQILMNLAVNARDAMPEGGNLTIETANVRIHEQYSSGHMAVPGEYVRLSVSDTGIGMDRDMITHIYEPFFTTKEMGKGTGLGLATVYGIVTQNSGFINVYSEPGLGTTFTLLFPRISHGPWASVDTVPPSFHAGSGAILLVEDNHLVRRSTGLMLKMMGYTVVEAETPREAIGLCRDDDRRIDLILTDVIMPDMSGKQMHEAIEAFRPGVAVLFMSGYTADVITDKGVLEEGVHFIQKPFDMDSLGRKMKSMLDPAAYPQ